MISVRERSPMLCIELSATRLIDNYAFAALAGYRPVSESNCGGKSRRKLPPSWHGGREGMHVHSGRPFASATGVCRRECWTRKTRPTKKNCRGRPPAKHRPAFPLGALRIAAKPRICAFHQQRNMQCMRTLPAPQHSHSAPAKHLSLVLSQRAILEQG